MCILEASFPVPPSAVTWGARASEATVMLQHLISSLLSPPESLWPPPVPVAPDEEKHPFGWEVTIVKSQFKAVTSAFQGALSVPSAYLETKECLPCLFLRTQTLVGERGKARQVSTHSISRLLSCVLPSRWCIALAEV